MHGVDEPRLFQHRRTWVDMTSRVSETTISMVCASGWMQSKQTFEHQLAGLGFRKLEYSIRVSWSRCGLTS